MLKRCTLLLLICTLLTGWLCPVQAGSMSNADKYQAALNELIKVFDGENSMTLNDLCATWQSLGAYKKSVSFRYYTTLLRDTELGDFTRLDMYIQLLHMDADFCALLTAENLPTVDELEAYIKGRQAEQANNVQAALSFYQQCGAMLDSMLRMENLLFSIPSATAVPTPSPTPRQSSPPPPAVHITPKPTKKSASAPIPGSSAVQGPTVIQRNVAIGDYRVTTYSNETCEIWQYLGSDEDQVIPRRIGNYTVTAIGDYALQGCTSRSITLPDTITTIGIGAFSECYSLVSITIPDSVTTIGGGAFAWCCALTDITLPDSVTKMGDEVFYNCYDLTSVILPSKITAIGEYMFLCCESLTSISIPEGVTSIGECAFSNCKALTALALPAGLRYIGSCAFFACSNLTSVALPAGITSLSNGVFGECGSLTSINIPSSVTSIDDYAMGYCASLTSITIPSTVTAIGKDVFIDCENLTLRVKKDSFAHQYAKSNKIPCVTY